MASNTIEHVVKIDTAQARADVDSFAAHVASRLKALESPVKIGVGLPSTAVSPVAPSGGSGISVNPMQGALSTNIALKTMTNGIMAATQAIQAFTSQLASFTLPSMGSSPRSTKPSPSSIATASSAVPAGWHSPVNDMVKRMAVMEIENNRKAKAEAEALAKEKALAAERQAKEQAQIAERQAKEQAKAAEMQAKEQQRLQKEAKERQARALAESTTRRNASLMTTAGIGDSINSALGGLMPGKGGGMASMLTGFGGGLVKAGTTLATGIAMAFGPVGAVVGSVIGILGTVTAGLFNAFGKIGDFLLSIPGMVFNAAKQILIAGGALAAAFAGSVFAAHKALGPAAEMERYKSQLDFMKKPDLLKFYQDLALKSPLTLKETVGAGILTENYGLDSKKYLPLFTDMAAALKKPIDEFSRTFGWAKGGNTGFAFENARQWGIDQKMMEAKGVRFDANGGVKDEDKAKFLNALTEIAQKKFGGMAASMAGGYEQLVSNLGDAIFQAFAKAGSGQGGASSALTWGKEIVKGITDTITFFGDKLSAIDWAGIGASFSVMVDKFKGTVESVDWKGISATVSSTMAKFGQDVAFLTSWNGLKAFGTMIKDIGMAFSELLMSTLSEIPALIKQGFSMGVGLVTDMIVKAGQYIMANPAKVATFGLAGSLAIDGASAVFGANNADTATGNITAAKNSFFKNVMGAFGVFESASAASPEAGAIESKLFGQALKAFPQQVYDSGGRMGPTAANLALMKYPELGNMVDTESIIIGKVSESLLSMDGFLTKIQSITLKIEETQEAIATMTSQMLEELRQQSQISQSAFSESFQL